MMLIAGSGLCGQLRAGLSGRRFGGWLRRAACAEKYDEGQSCGKSPHLTLLAFDGDAAYAEKPAKTERC